jgi:hypothetical protein
MLKYLHLYVQSKLSVYFLEAYKLEIISVGIII